MKLFHILTLTLIVAMTAVPAFAETRTQMRPSSMTGPYIGVYGGYDWNDAQSVSAADNTDPQGWEGGVFVGYKLDTLLGRDRNVGFAANTAIEVFYGFSNADDTSGATTVDKNDEWGVSLRPGLSFLDMSMGNGGYGINPYGIVGYRHTEFETSGNSDWYNGFEMGLGTQLIASGNVGLRLEYSHVWYNAENGIDPDSDGLRVGVSYSF